MCTLGGGTHPMEQSSASTKSTAKTAGSASDRSAASTTNPRDAGTEPDMVVVSPGVVALTRTADPNEYTVTV